MHPQNKIEYESNCNDKPNKCRLYNVFNLSYSIYVRCHLSSLILYLAIACRKYEQLTMPFIGKPSSAARRETVSSNRYLVCGENCSFRCFKFVAPSLF